MSSEIQFCTDCSNLLYPKEDREHKQLIFLCRSCDHLQYADPYSSTQNCVDRLNYNFRSKEDVNSYIAQGLGHDPTLPRAPDWRCPKCANLGAVYFQLPERVADDAMTLVYVCTNCTFYQVKGKETRDQEIGDDDEQGVEKMDVRTEETVEKEQQKIVPKDGLDEEDDEALFGEHDDDISQLKVDDDGFEDLGLGLSDDDNDDENESSAV